MKPVEKFMKLAIEEAKKARESGDYGIGAVIVKENKVVATAGNRIKLDNDPTHHAEIVAIRKATKLLKNRFLEDCILYTTHEPCPMCTSAAVWARMRGIVFGSTLQDMIEYRLKAGNRNWSWRTIDMTALEIIEKGNPKLLLVEKFLREECIMLFHSS